jgi:hypothetical protein
MTDPLFVWTDPHGRGRNLYACFRRSFALAQTPRAAHLNIFADSYYNLFVNGAFVHCGPVRFDPREPFFDNIDLAPYLRAGTNTLAVLVNSFQHKTYKALPHCAGFIAWGEISSDAGDVVSLTTPGDWRAVPSPAHQRFMPKMSFALNAIEIYDDTAAVGDWHSPDFDDGAWPPAVPLADQTAWGALQPRPCALFPLTPVEITRVQHLLPLADDEMRISFMLPMPQFYEDNKNEFSGFIAYRTWVYSPAEQDVQVGVFWGEHWLNGDALPQGTPAVNKNMRYTQQWRLHTGWNYLFGKVGAYRDVVDQFFAVPRASGLVFSTDRTHDGTCRFEHSPLLTAAQFAQHLRNLPLPYPPEETLAALGGWLRCTDAQRAHSPCRDTSWDTYADPQEALTPARVNGHVFRHALYPRGFSLLLDLQHIHLVFPCLRLRGVRGATVDLTYNEHLRADQQHILHMHHYQGGDRVLCAHDELVWQPTHPRGMRYLMLTVRNAAGDVTLDALTLRRATYPFTQHGSFECADPLLNEIWAMGPRTLAATAEDVYTDCAGRERGMYLRDTVIQYFINLASFGDQAVMRHCLNLYALSPAPDGLFRAVYPNSGDYTISDFALNAFEGYAAYYQHTGDRDVIRHAWPAMQQTLAWYAALSDERDDKLLNADWHIARGLKPHYGGFHGDNGTTPAHMSTRGIHCVFSCTYLLALQAAHTLARALGHRNEAAALRARATALGAALQQFWNPGKGCYADNLAFETHSAHASLFAVRAGVATKQQLPLIRAHIARVLPSVFVNGYDPGAGTLFGPSFSFYIFDGLYRLGMAGHAQELMRQGWGWMLARGLRTCAEHFKVDTTSMSVGHGWSAAPTYFLSKYALGIHYPKLPNTDIVELRVQAPGLLHARGTWPHPRGVIEVAWHMDGTRRVFDTLRAPSGVQLRVMS